MKFTVYIDRDIPIEARNDRHAGLIAKALHEGIDELLAKLEAGALTHELHEYTRTTCQRGINHKTVFDAERRSEEP